MAEEKKRLDQVREMIEAGTYTKAEIAEALDIKPAGVSSQMTYLRWQGNFIKTDADTKVLSFCTEEEFKAIEADKAARAATRTTASKKTPEEQAAAVAKTIKTQTKQMETWQAKLDEYLKDKAAFDETGEGEDIDQDLIDEAEANVTLLRIKIKRNTAKASELPDAPADEAPDADAGDTDPEETGTSGDEADDGASESADGSEDDLL
jgi:hypothetical protein